MYDLFKEALKIGAYGGALSGAGPSLLFFAPLGKGKSIASSLAKRWEEIIENRVEIIMTNIDYRGAIVMEVI